jgi:TMEM175 potassium channel family protein
MVDPEPAGTDGGMGASTGGSQTLTTSRLEALSDGVIAIAATLLVIDIGTVMVGDDESLLDAIFAKWPSFLAYLVSFTVIGLIWVAHHGMFDRVRAVDRPLIFSNLALLLLVGFIPWPTQLLAEFISEGGRDASVATAIYSFVMMLIGLVFTTQWWHLNRHPELVTGTVTSAQLRRSLDVSWVSPAVYAVTIPLAFVSPYVCIAAYAALAIFLARGPSSRALVAGAAESS